jgi:glycine hydroxymethyltransferase
MISKISKLAIHDIQHIATWTDEAITAAVKGDERRIERIGDEIPELLAGFPIPGVSAV